MTEVIDCPVCRKAVTVSDELRGRVMACPHCGRHFTVGQSGPAVPVAAPPSNFPTGRHAVRFTFSCTRCASILEASGDHCGTTGRCPTCGAVFTIPQVDPRTGVPSSSAFVADDGQLPTPMHAYATAGVKAPKIVRLESGEDVIVCPRCNRQSPLDSNQCKTCGTPYTIEGAEAVVHGSGNTNGLASAAITVALIGLCIPFIGLVGAGLGIAAMHKASEMGQTRPGYSMAVAALVVGLILFGINLTCIMF